jgi:dephospho-CoA kinase
MIKLGITGGIGSGKSYVSNIIRRQGFPVYDCDEQARRLILSDADVRSALVALLGDGLFGEGGFNRALMADYLFANEDHARCIDAIVHPAVKRDFVQWASNQSSLLVGVESAILYESGMRDLVDRVLLVSAPKAVCLGRAMQRDGATEEQVRARMARQLSDEERRRLSDFEIVNNGTGNDKKLIAELKHVLFACGVPPEAFIMSEATSEEKFELLHTDD